MLSDVLQQLTSQKSSIEDDIHSTFEELQKTLNVRKSVLLMELEVSYGLKQKVSCANATFSMFGDVWLLIEGLLLLQLQLLLLLLPFRKHRHTAS